MPDLDEAEAASNQERIARRVREAQQVLDDNWLGSSTKPAPDLYPHQWNWDSGFIAIGNSHYRPNRARQELTSLFEAQWDNGMVPQIVFNEDALGGYFPEPDFWQAERSPNAPGDHLTSGITMPPVHGMAVWHVVANTGESQASLEWAEDMFPKLIDLHAFLYRERDPEDEGLAYIRHPWESGLDNSPVWDHPLEQIDLAQVNVPEYERRDLSTDIPEEQRPGDRDYDRYVYLVDLFRQNNYDEQAIERTCPFLVQDPLFNSILSASNQGLILLADRLGKSADQLREWDRRTRRGLNQKLWDEETGLYQSYDRVNETVLREPTSMSFMPLLCQAASPRRAQRLYEVLESKSFCPIDADYCINIPNYDLNGKDFDGDNYWRGPVWINTNWLLMTGIRRYGWDQKYRTVRDAIVELICQEGFHEYFDPHDGTGYGTDGFSWSAALFLDVYHNHLD